MKIGIRIFLAFACIFLLLIIQIAFAIYSSNQLVQTQHDALTNQLTLMAFRDELAQLRIKMFTLLGTLDPATMETLKAEIETLSAKLMEESSTLNLPQEMLRTSQQTYQEIIAQHWDFRTTEAYDLINSTSKEEYEQLYEELETLRKNIDTAAQETVRQSNRQFLVVTFTLCGVGLFIVLLWGWYLIHSIAGPIKQAAHSAQMIANGDLSLEIRTRRKDETGQLLTSMGVMIARLKAMSSEVAALIQAIHAGELERRGNAEAFAGGWRNLIQGINSVVDAFVAPINMTAQSIDRIAKGEIPDMITAEYQGDFNTIKLNLNSLIASTADIAGLAEELAEGNLEIELKERSEQDMLMSALNLMVQQLRQVVKQVKTAANMVTVSSKELDRNAEQMAKGAIGQATATEEASASLEEMAANIKQNANNAVQTEQIAKKTAEDADEGGQAVTQTVTAMKEIVEKILIIEEISQETRILSLNATIEAARASEYGKAFSTVASEVRQLADTTKKAAEEIKQLSNSSVAIAEHSQEVLMRIVPNSQTTAELVQEISMANSEQSTGVNQVNLAIVQLDQVTQQNSAIAEEVADMAAQLTDQALHLQNAIEFFKLDADDVSEEPEGASETAPIAASVLSKGRINKFSQKKPRATSRNAKRTQEVVSDQDRSAARHSQSGTLAETACAHKQEFDEKGDRLDADFEIF